MSNSASRILAVALFECLPGMILENAANAWGGFFCDFAFKGPFSSEILVQLEERIRGIVRDKREIRGMEMVPSVAAEFLRSLGQTARAQQALSQDDFVPIVQIGSFADLSEGKELRHTGEAGFFRLLDKKNLGNGRYRIFGVSAASKEELQKKIRQWKAFPALDHESRGQTSGFWDLLAGNRVWLAPGVAFRRSVIDFWRDAFSGVPEIDGSGDWRLLAERYGPFMRLQRESGPSNHLRGLLDDPAPLVWQIYSPMNYASSFLQTVHKSLTILGFNYRGCFFGKKQKSALFCALEQLPLVVDRAGKGMPRIEFLAADALGCEWPVAAMTEERGGAILLTVWVERNLALLLEKECSPLTACESECGHGCCCSRRDV